jgi:hypothetical protein
LDRADEKNLKEEEDLGYIQIILFELSQEKGKNMCDIYFGATAKQQKQWEVSCGEQ